MTLSYIGLIMLIMFVQESVNVCFLRRLRVHGVDKNVLLLFYRAAIETIIHYGISTWFGNLTVKFRSQLQNLIKWTGKIIGMLPPSSLQEIFEQTVMKQGQKITTDPNHILYKEYELMPSGRRYRLPNCKLNRYKFAFIPLSIKLLNSRK